MAGEVLQKIRKKEEEAREIIEKVKDDAQGSFNRAQEEKKKLIEKKDALLKDEEVRIKDRYAAQASKILKEIELEEQNRVADINSTCEKNLPKVVSYISEEIVKE